MRFYFGANKHDLDSICITNYLFLVLCTWTISWFRWSIGCLNFWGTDMVIVIVMFSMSTSGIGPFQLKNTGSKRNEKYDLKYLCFKSWVFLWQIFLDIVFSVAPPVAPFKCVQSGDIYVLKMCISLKIAILTRPGDCKFWRSSTLGVGKTGDCSN